MSALPEDAPVLRESDVRAILRRAVVEAGSARAWARQHGVSEQWLGQVLKRRKAVGMRIGLALGFRRQTVWTKAPEGMEVAQRAAAV